MTTFEAYRETKALNWSSLKLMDESPLAYRWALEHPREDTPSLELGVMAHCLVLEPDALLERYVIPEVRQCISTTKKGERCSKPSTPGAEHCSTHGGKEEAEAWLLGLGRDDVQIVSPKQKETIRYCSESIWSNPDAAALLRSCTEREVSVSWTLAGVPCKGRMDALGPARLVDLKTSRSLRRYQGQASDLLYHGQLAWYLDGAGAAELLDDLAEVYTVVVETSAPYDSAVFRLPPSVIDEGRALYQRLFATLRACQAQDYWPGRYPGITEYELPRWHRAGGQEEEVW